MYMLEKKIFYKFNDISFLKCVIVWESLKRANEYRKTKMQKRKPKKLAST
jgi:hypothetical protein